MAGAYTSLVSLMNTIHLIHNHSRHSFSFDKNQIDSLLDYAEYFLQFIESYNSHARSKQVEDLESYILYAARSAQDLLESLVFDQIVAGSTLDRREDHGPKSSSFLHDLQTKMKAMKTKFMKVPEKIRAKVDADYREQKRFAALFETTDEKSPSYSTDLEYILDYRMSSMMEDVKEVKEESRFKDQQPTDFMASASSTTLKTGKTSAVGFDDNLIQLMDVLTGNQSARQIISVVGMGGLGKTTLARNVYEHLLILQHFDIRAWATISQGYNIKEILLELLSRKGETTRDTADELGEQLHKKLSGRRYLIMLDDMWTSEVWDKIRFFFPDNGNGSRVVVTTRLSYVASYFSDSSMAMELLNEDKSWELFCVKVFGEEEDCPIELKEIGEEIVEHCKGLPLSIVVIAGQLRKSSRSKKQWMKVADNMITFLDSGEDQCLSILSSSYSHLPTYLKPCFLYIGTFPEDKEISVSTLIRFWIAHGFLRSEGHQMLEEVAEGYLKDLVERNLISVEKKGRNGKFSTCKVHDLIRELCLKVGEKEKFFCALNHPAGSSRCNMGWGICRTYMAESKLLRILPKAEAELNEDEFNPDCLEAMFKHFNMRYISGYLHWQRSFESFHLDQQKTLSQIRSRLPYACLPSSINLLWNLQTIVIRGMLARILAPPEIWDMPQLRHVDVSDLIRLPDPPPVEGDGDFVMQNLQTLMIVENFKLVERVCRRIPNIKELKMHYNVLDQAEYYQHNLGCFNKLESLRCEFDEGSDWRDFSLKLAFPSSLQELTLGSSGLRWEDMSMIGSLPCLQVLTLCYKNSVRGEEWNPVEGEFLRLKSLTIYSCDDLVCWNAEKSHFPVLESVTLGYAYKLSEFPSDIGEIPTLGCVYLDRCSVSAAVSAMRMLVEQEELGNEDLRLEIEFDNEEELQSVRKIVEEEDIESSNLHLKIV